MPYLDSDPIYRGLHRCARCLLPDSFPNIRFDDSGVCNYCHSDTTFKEKGEQAFTELLDEYRSKGREYDCIAPISGGRR
jgi:glucosamine--fructose-6-phosphate aminotransferase (isomerizing)